MWEWKTHFWYGKGELAKSNADQVRRIRTILEELSLEIATPEDASIDDLASAAKAAGVQLALCNASMGDFMSGGPGLSAVPGRQAEFKDAISRARAMAGALNCKTVHIGASLVPEGMSRQDCYETYLENTGFAARQMAESGITLTIEALNSFDKPTIFLSHVRQVLQIIDELDFSSLFRLLDKLGYDGWVGAEYQPSGITEKTLGWFKPFHHQQA